MSRYYSRTGGFNMYPFRNSVSNYIAKTGLVPNFKGVDDTETHNVFANFQGEMLARKSL
jgi:hypothetical protein